MIIQQRPFLKKNCHGDLKVEHIHLQPGQKPEEGHLQTRKSRKCLAKKWALALESCHPRKAATAPSSPFPRLSAGTEKKAELHWALQCSFLPFFEVHLDTKHVWNLVWIPDIMLIQIWSGG